MSTRSGSVALDFFARFRIRELVGLPEQDGKLTRGVSLSVKLLGEVWQLAAPQPPKKVDYYSIDCTVVCSHPHARQSPPQTSNTQRLVPPQKCAYLIIAAFTFASAATVVDDRQQAGCGIENNNKKNTHNRPFIDQKNCAVGREFCWPMSPPAS